MSYALVRETIMPVLQQHGYQCHPDTVEGTRPSGGVFKHNLLVEGHGARCAVSVKEQINEGSIEAKVAWDLLSLGGLLADQDLGITAAYIVLNGPGMRPELRQYFLGGGLQEQIPAGLAVQILELEEFLDRAANQEL